MKAHSEGAFEAYIEQHLLEHGGYRAASPDDYDRKRALLPDELFSFIKATQPKVWERLHTIHHDKLEEMLLDGLCKALDQQGSLAVIRHGLKFYGQTVRLAFFAPAHGLNPDVEARYDANRLTVLRQVKYDPNNENSIDLVLFLNGIPVVTAELKNQMTGQCAVVHAKKQYKFDRDENAPMFRFKKRALVHFAVDPDEVWMTTQLRGSRTFFLPFNLGREGGAGNPPAEGKHRTHYLWEDVWQRDSLLNLIGSFIHLQVETKLDPWTGKKRTTETMIFPRYHQRDAVRRLLAAAKENGPGTNYLVQHSAGSGKSNTIGWLAHRLASLHDKKNQKIYDSVVVLTDRLVLDQQLQETIYQFEHKRGVVEKIETHSGQLADALESGVPIIISTIHKFGFISDKIGSLPKRSYAVIVDEAHSSQSGDMAVNVKQVLSETQIAAQVAEAMDDDDAATIDQLALRSAIARGRQPNLSFFAFTATPKFKTLEMFGHRGEDGKPAAFHLYTMRQAIEEGFILDVLTGYTTYKRYFQLVKAVEDDPDLDKRKAARALARFVNLHPTNIAQKTEVMVEHFRACVRDKIGGRAKAMVVTGSRLAAVKYKLAFDKYIKEKRYQDVRCLVAFSGEVRDPDLPGLPPYTEVEMNLGIKEKELPERFASDEYQVLLVAEKYQTGFDQPLLHTMYVDKRLSGIQAVQTLSRLNRTCRGKEETFVLDFVNEREEILDSFQDYYEGTTIAESVDPQRLYELQSKIDESHVYLPAEVDRFAKIFFKLRADQNPGDHPQLNACLDPAVDRFKALEEEAQTEFRDTLAAFKNLYSFLAQIVPFSDAELEKLYAYGRMLLRKLPRPEGAGPIDLGDDVALYSLVLRKEAEGDLGLRAGEASALYGPSATGTRKGDPATEKLSTIIELINERFGTDFDAQDLVEGVAEQLADDEQIQQAADVNDKANFAYVFNPKLDDALVDRHGKHGDFIDKVFSDEAIGKLFRSLMLDRVYALLHPGEQSKERDGGKGDTR